MPAVAHRYFEALHHALAEQYKPCNCEACKKTRLNLSDDNKLPVGATDLLKTAEKAFKKLYQNGNYNPKDLFKNSEYQALANGTAELFTTAIPHNTPTEMRTYLEQDVFVFSQLKTHTQLTEARQYLKDNNGNIRTYQQFERDILKINKAYNKNYLRVEHNFAVRSAQTAAQWANLQDDTDRYWLEYNTDGGKNVRPSHQAMHGICLPKDDPFWDNYMPQNGWECHCFAVEVLAREKTKSDSKKALELGEQATTQINKNGKNVLEMFRFNPGKQKKVFPPNNSYTKVVGSNVVLKVAQEQAKKHFETWEVVPTKKGQLKVSSKHGINERTENIEIASYFTNKYEHKIKLLGVSNKQKTADAFNETLGIKQEYKRPTKATKNAIDNAIKDGKKQADHIVLDIVLDFDDEILKRGIKGRVSQAETVKTITIIRKGNDKTYTREEILSADFEL